MSIQTIAEKPLDLNEWAYNTIKEMILSNNLTAGSQINLDEMAEVLHISRTPIREALIRLKQNGLVEARARVGFFVTSISPREFKDVFEVRRVIECYAAGRCVALMTQDKVNKLIYHHEQGKLMMEKHLPKEFNTHEIRFHDLIIESLDNDQINRIRSSFEDQICRTRMYSLESYENLRCSVEEHASIVRAIVRHDSISAEAAMNVHICNVEQRLSQYLLGLPDDAH